MTPKKIFLLLIPFIYLLFLLLKVDPSFDVDLGRHIKMGQIISECGCVPDQNLFSFTHPEYKTVTHSWLSEVIFFQFASLFGITSLLYLKAGIIVITFGIVYMFSVKKEAFLTSVLFSLLTVAIFATRFTVRPELFSYLFIALFLLIFELYKRRHKMIFLWLLPFITVLWVNMHIYFFLAFLLFASFLVEDIITNKKFNKAFIPLSLVMLCAPFINPAFVAGAFYPLHIFNNYGAPIIENYPAARLLTFHTPLSPQFITILIFEVVSCFALAGVLLYPRKKMIAVKVNTTVGILLGQLLIRCMALFSLLGLPFVIKEYIFLENHVAKSAKKKFAIVLNSVLLISFIILFVTQIKLIIMYKQLHFGFQMSQERAVNFFSKNNLQGNIFNNPSVGNYLVYRLYPNQKVFIDSRPEAYPSIIFDEYFKMLQDKNYFNEQTEKYNINVIFFSPIEYPQFSRTFLANIIDDSHWAPV